MSNKNVCPYCGSDLISADFLARQRKYYGYCDNWTCLAAGPISNTKEEAIQAFCNPKYLLEQE